MAKSEVSLSKAMAIREWIQRPFDFVSAYMKPGSPTQPPAQPPLSYRGGGLTRKQPIGDQVRDLRRLDPQTSVLFDRGLRNKPGENNCFLNAAVQVNAVYVRVLLLVTSLFSSPPSFLPFL